VRYAMGRMSKYDGLREYLERLPPGSVTLTFAMIDEVVPRGLPSSAYSHRGWWANEVDGHHVQALSWLEAGRTVDEVNLQARRVRFSARGAAHPSVSV
jgi:hypothetical protein